MNSIERLVYMVNQIAANLATDDDPVAATSRHILLYWDPRMKKLILENECLGLTPVAAAAVSRLSDTKDAA